MEIENPLVTVAVITYNSSRTIIETLESIKSQTYNNICLIVSDDASKDDTVRICQEWIENNSRRFFSSDIITSETNTGVSANCNRAMDSCHTDFIKGIAGDDLLMPNCIEDNINYCKQFPETVVVFSRMAVFGPSNFVKRYISPFDFSFFNLSAEEQLKRLSERGNCIPASTAFFNVNRVRELGIRHDERIPLLEDLPMWVTLTRKGIHLPFYDKETVKYRVGSGGLTSGASLSPAYVRSYRLYELYYHFEEAYEQDSTAAIAKLAEKEMQMVQCVKDSMDYKVGHLLVSPLRYLRDRIVKRFTGK